MSYRIDVTDKAGLTLADLEYAVRQARAAGAADGCPVNAVIKLGGRAKSITIDVNATAAHDTIPADDLALPQPDKPSTGFWGE